MPKCNRPRQEQAIRRRDGGALSRVPPCRGVRSEHLPRRDLQDDDLFPHCSLPHKADVAGRKQTNTPCRLPVIKDHASGHRLSCRGKITQPPQPARAQKAERRCLGQVRPVRQPHHKPQRLSHHSVTRVIGMAPQDPDRCRASGTCVGSRAEGASANLRAGGSPDMDKGQRQAQSQSTALHRTRAVQPWVPPAVSGGGPVRNPCRAALDGRLVGRYRPLGGPFRRWTATSMNCCLAAPLR